MKDIPSVSIYFSTRNHWTARVIRALTFSWCSHVAVGDEHAVLDVKLDDGTRYVPFILYNTYRQVRPQVAFHLGRRKEVDFTRYEEMPPPSWTRIAIRWMTLGLIPYSGDCLGVVKDVLEQDGIPVPRRITTPGGLQCWLDARGFLRGTE
jgi:hypothetical protein